MNEIKYNSKTILRTLYIYIYNAINYSQTNQQINTFICMRFVEFESELWFFITFLKYITLTPPTFFTTENNKPLYIRHKIHFKLNTCEFDCKSKANPCHVVVLDRGLGRLVLFSVGQAGDYRRPPADRWRHYRPAKQTFCFGGWQLR